MRPSWRLRRQGRKRLAALAMPQPFSVDGLCARISESRGRDLHLHALPFTGAPNLPCGMWIATDEADHIFHAQGASALHRQNIILHEIGHMLCGHSMTGDDSGLAALLGDLDPKVVHRVLMRTRYSTPEEQEAEMIAALITEAAGWTPPAPRPEGALGVLDDVFGVARDE